MGRNQGVPCDVCNALELATLCTTFLEYRKSHLPRRSCATVVVLHTAGSAREASFWEDGGLLSWCAFTSTEPRKKGDFSTSCDRPLFMSRDFRPLPRFRPYHVLRWAVRSVPRLATLLHPLQPRLDSNSISVMEIQLGQKCEGLFSGCGTAAAPAFVFRRMLHLV